MKIDVNEAFRKVVTEIAGWVNYKLDDKVDKEGNKKLTDENYSATDKDRVDNMATGLIVIDDILFLKTDNGYMYQSGIDLSQYGGGGGGPGGGGAGTSSKVTLENLLSSNELTVALGSKVELKFNFKSENSNNGTAMIYIDNDVKGSKSITSGNNSIDVSEYLNSGYNKLTLTCVDAYGHKGELIYVINVITLSLTTSFNDALSYSGEYFEIPYVLTADGDKVMYFEFDGERTRETISSSGTNSKKKIYFGNRSHGVYPLKVYAEMRVSGNTIKSDVYEFEVMYAIGTTPLISSVCNISDAKQYETINIPFSVYHSTNAEPVVDLIISQDGVVHSQKTMVAPRDKKAIWYARTSLTGNVTFTISYEGVSKSHTIAVAETDLSVSVRQDDLAFELKADGKDNNDIDKDIWESDNGDVSVTFENVGWNIEQKTFSIYNEDTGTEIKKQYAIGTGWVTDDNGRTALRLAGDARATVEFQPFAEDWMQSGKTIEMEFAIRDVNNRDAVVISCMNNNVGFKVTADTASLIRNNTPLVNCKYVDDEKIHVAFVVEKQVMGDHTVRLITTYLNGVLSGAATFADTDTLFQNPAANISIGSPDCSIDLYMVRFYDVALTHAELRDNYIADCMDVNLLSDNDIYVNGAIEYNKLESKIPIIRITGELPSKKADSNVKKGGRDYPVDVIYTNKSSVPLIKDHALIHVQGTSSEGYVRKNWDLDFDVEYQHMEDQMPTDYFTLKADYVDSSGCHNTGHANFVHNFYTKDDPPFTIDSRARSTIAGFPCVIFHRKTNNDPYVFAGKYNFNFSKNSENVFGFTATTEDGTPVYPKMQSWEFCENKYLACRFRQDPDDPNIVEDDWKEWFDDRYLYDGGDLEDFKEMYRWVYSTCQDNATGEALSESYVYDDVTYTHDTKEYRLAKFKKEFTDHFDMSFSLVYYLYTFVMLMVDQRAKNQFLTSFDGKIWYPWLYDNDTCFGINNEGFYRYFYYSEDSGQNSMEGQTHVYNGYDSVLWNNFAEAFKDDIQKTYSTWRSGTNPLLSYDSFIENFITNISEKYSISLFNEDQEYKYISLYRNGDNPEFLYQVKGTEREYLKYFIKNRLMYCDSKWGTGDFINKDNNTILLRLNAPDGIEDEEIKPDMTIRYKTFSNMYAGARFGTNGVLNSQYTDRNELVAFKMPEGEDPNNLDTYIFGANEISELEDLSLLYCNLINIGAASKLKKLVVGNNHPNYRNDVLKNLSFSNNRLLREVNVCNCTGLTNILDFSLCPDIQYIYATGSNIAGVQLPNSSFLKKLHLPATTSNLTIVNQKHIEEFKCEGYDNLSIIKIENSINMPIQEIILGCKSDVLASVSIKNMDWNADSEENLQQVIDKLIACHGSVIEGTVYLPSGVAVSNNLKVKIHQNFPNLNVIDDNPVFYIDYYNYDNTIWDTETVEAGHDAIGPQKGNPDDIIQELQGLRHLFVKWNDLPVNVNKNYQVAATWLTQYLTKYYNEDELFYDYWADKDSTAIDPVEAGERVAPTKEGTDDLRYKFVGWDNLPTNINKTTDINAVFANVYPVRFYTTEDSSTPLYSQWVVEGEDAYDPITEDGWDTPSEIMLSVDKKLVFSTWDNIPKNISGICNVYATYDTYWTVRFYNEPIDGKGYTDEVDMQWVKNGSNAVNPITRPDKPIDTPKKESTAQYHFTFSNWDKSYSNIIEATKVYAEYSSEIRKYNVEFYNLEDGKEILLYTQENIRYGDSAIDPSALPNYSTPIKLGVEDPTLYDFTGWSPSYEDIKGHTKCYAIFRYNSYLFGKLEDEANPDWDLINSYWTQIDKDSTTLSRDEFNKKYPIGGRMLIPVTLDKAYTVDVEIIAHDHDVLTNGSGKSALTFFCKVLPDFSRPMYNQNNNSGSNAKGWTGSTMRSFLNGELYNALPSELRNVIKQVVKISDGGAENKSLVTTNDYCWIPSYDEVSPTITRPDVIPGQGECYSDTFSDGASRLRYKSDGYTIGQWWLRTSTYSETTSSVLFLRIRSDNGGFYLQSASGLQPVAFGFCIGRGSTNSDIMSYATAVLGEGELGSLQVGRSE